MSVRKKEELWFFNSDSEPLKSDTHDVVIHALNRWRDFKRGQTKRPVYFSVENFSGTEADWEGIPIIYSKNGHPKLPFRTDPVKALESCRGEIVGAFHSASVDTSGTAKFRGKVDFSTDSIEDKHREGKLALSSGFYLAEGHDQLGRLRGKVIPDHIIVFDSDGPINPQDPAAMFLNASEKDNPGTPSLPGIRDLFEKFKEFAKGYFLNASPGGALLKEESKDVKQERLADELRNLAGITPDSSHYLYIEDLFDDSVIYRLDGELFRRDYSEDTPGVYTFSNQVAVQIGYLPVMNASEKEGRTGSGDTMTLTEDATKTIEGLTATIAERDALLVAKNAEFEAAKAQLEEFKRLKAEQDAAEVEKRWLEVKGKYLKPGQVKKPEDETKLKEMFLKDKDSFYLNAVLAVPRKGDTEREGAEFYGNADDSEEADVEKLVSELRMRTGRGV